jgi:hypothetical protein
VQGLFPADALQQLLDSSPTPAARRSVWRIAERLPCLAAAARLRVNTLRLLAAGELLPGGFSGLGPGERDELRSILACLAAAPCGPKLSALLAAALGLPWGPEPGAGGAPAAAAAAAEGEGEEGGEGGEDEVACRACGKAQPEHNLLLCDGCDAAYHTACLRPRLKAVPEGEWFCPGCDADIRGSRLTAEGALEWVIGGEGPGGCPRQQALRAGRSAAAAAEPDRASGLPYRSPGSPAAALSLPAI